jgi:hypothetical protein
MDLNEWKQRLKKENPDLYAFSKIQKIKKLLKILFFEVLAVGLVALSVPHLRHAVEIMIPLLIATIGLCVFIPIMMKPKKLLFGKDFVGVIEEIHYKHEYESEDLRSPIKETEIMVFHIKDEHGKIQLLDLHPKYRPYYSEGDEVLYIRGLRYPIVLNHTDKEMIACPCCGAIGQSREGRCLHCYKTFFNTQK